MSRIWDDAPYSQSTLLVLLCLADMANDDGVCWPSVETIAKKARVTTRWVRDVLEELETDGWVGKEPRTGKTTRYHVYCPPMGGPTPEPQFTPEETSPLNPTSGEGGTPVQPTPEPQFRDPGTPVQPNHKEPSIEPPSIPAAAADYLTPDGLELAMPIIEQAGLDLNEVIQHFNDSKYYHGIPRYEYFQHWVRLEAVCKREGKPLPGLDVIPTPKDIDEAFQMFWDAYPKKERRPIALAAFKAAVKKTHPITIIRQAMGYARKMERDHKEDQFIAGPAQWLNDERWTDKYPEPVRDLSRTAADY